MEVNFRTNIAHSRNTKVLRGSNEYAKSNASVAIRELIQIAANKAFSENHKDKLSITARLNMDGTVTILGLLFRSR